MGTEKWIVGPEHDETLLRELGRVIKGLGFNIREEWSDLAGSQEIGHWEVESDEGKLVIEAETYIGLSVEGERSLVTRVRAAFNR